MYVMDLDYKPDLCWKKIHPKRYLLISTESAVFVST